LTQDKPDKKKRNYYDVEQFRKIYSETAKTRGRLGRSLNRFFSVIDSMQGFFIALIGLPIMFGSLGAVIVGAYYGPWAFIGIMGTIIGGLALIVEKKVGPSLQFGEYNFGLRFLATGIAFLVLLGTIYFLIFWSRLRLF
jgi:hypothetical protein